MSIPTTAGAVRARAGALAALFLLLTLAACGGAERRYDLVGKVVSVEKEDGEITVAHEAIPGFMDAMTMPFRLKDAWALDVVAPGDRIEATLVVAGRASWLEGVVVSRESAQGEPTALEGEAAEPRPGTTVPPLALVNQDRVPIRLDGFGGQVLVVTFIYTRCPLPDYCPLMTTNLAAVERALSADAAVYGRTRLLSVTVDPEFDTPEVLRAYGENFAGRSGPGAFERWQFATGTPEQVREVASFFGLSYRAEADQIVHTLRTAVVAPDGTLHRIYRGNEWKPSELARDVAALAASARD